MFKLKKNCAVLSMLLLFYSLPVFPKSNAHTHLFYDQTYEDYKAALEAMGLTIGDIEIKDFDLKKKINSDQFLSGLNLVFDNKINQQDFEQIVNNEPKMSELFHLISAKTNLTSDVVARSFFEEAPGAHPTPEGQDNIFKYFFRTNIHLEIAKFISNMIKKNNTIILKSDEIIISENPKISKQMKDEAKINKANAEVQKSKATEALKILYRAAIDRSNVRSGEVLSVSGGGPSFYPGNQIFKEVAQEKGVHLELFFSLPRKNFQQNLKDPQNFERTLTEFEKQYRMGNVDGIDISGSILETEDRANENSLQYEAKLRQIFSKFNEMAANGLSPAIKIHAFEGTQGRPKSFYEALFTVLSEHAKTGSSITIRIGHIAGITASDIQKFSEIFSTPELKRRLIFELNAESNVYLQGLPLKTLQQTVQKLVSSQFMVIEGTDGGSALTGSEPELRQLLQDKHEHFLKNKTAAEEKILTDSELKIQAKALVDAELSILKEIREMIVQDHNSRQLVDRPETILAVRQVLRETYRNLQGCP